MLKIKGLKYRIIEKDKCFYIHFRFLFIWWVLFDDVPANTILYFTYDAAKKDLLELVT